MSATQSRDRPLRAPMRFLRFVSRTWNHPILLKELRGRMRGWRAILVLTIHLLLLSCLASLIYLIVAESADRGSVGKVMGQSLFYSTYMLLMMAVVLLAPAFTAGAISGERERKTLDILITTLLPMRSLVMGKLTSALAYIVLLVLVALPIQSLALIFGGVIPSELIVGTIILLVTGLITGTVGIFISSLLKSSIASTVITYAIILLTTMGLPIMASVVIGFVGSLVSPQLDDLHWLAQAALLYLGGFLLCTNPFSASITTLIVLDEENTLFFFTTKITDSQGISHTIPLVSPWLVYVTLYLFVSAVLVLASIVVLKRRRG